MLEINGLFKSFRRPGLKDIETPLRGVSFYVKAGEIVGLMGKSGEGKSTVARLLCGTLLADAGSATFYGKKLLSTGKYDRETGFGIQIIPQQPFAALDPRQRIGEAVAEVLLCHKIAGSKADAMKRTKELLREVMLDDSLIARLPSQLSGGQAQRAVIARTLAVEPRLLIADEATSMLDMTSQAQIISILNGLVTEKRMSVLLISHDPELVEVATDRSYLLSGGDLKEIKKER